MTPNDGSASPFRRSCATAEMKEREHSIVHCSYCGSISVADFIRFLKQPGTRFSGSDWKYGWPHKFYVEPVNPDAAKVVQVGSQNFPEEGGPPLGEGPNDYWSCHAHPTYDIGKPTVCACPREPRVTGCWNRAVMGTRAYLFLKFYNKHLEQATPEQWLELTPLVEKVFGIRFEKDEKGIKYVVPAARTRGDQVYGFQRAGLIQEDGAVQHTL